MAFKITCKWLSKLHVNGFQNYMDLEKDKRKNKKHMG
jgi:hypothetical protein